MTVISTMITVIADIMKNNGNSINSYFEHNNEIIKTSLKLFVTYFFVKVGRKITKTFLLVPKHYDKKKM